MEENDLAFELSPPQETLYGKLLAFLVGENEKPIDLTASYFKRSKKRLRKKQNKDEQEVVVKKEEETKSAETATCDVCGTATDTREIADSTVAHQFTVEVSSTPFPMQCSGSGSRSHDLRIMNPTL